MVKSCSVLKCNAAWLEIIRAHAIPSKREAPQVRQQTNSFKMRELARSRKKDTGLSDDGRKRGKFP
jgi:hypothetical protein